MSCRSPLAFLRNFKLPEELQQQYEEDSFCHVRSFLNVFVHTGAHQHTRSCVYSLDGPLECLWQIVEHSIPKHCSVRFLGSGADFAAAAAPWPHQDGGR